MNTYTDEEVLLWVNQQEHNFRVTARGFGFEAIQAKVKLEYINKLSNEEKLRIGRLNLETIEKEGTYLNQLPK